MIHALTVTDLRTGYGKKRAKEIVHGVSFTVDNGQFACIIGANGCGKTTTLKAAMGLLPLMAGSVKVDGEEVSSLDETTRAKRFAYIPQAHRAPFPFTVADVVLLGRTPHLAHGSRPTEADLATAYEALDLLGLVDLAHTAYTTLSGGQQQLVLIARALAQESNILVMDEPTAVLDFGNQHLVLSRMQELSRLGKAVVMVTHDPDHALFCADKVVVMEEGRVLASGTPQECITTEMLRRIYGTDARVMDVEIDPGRVERVCIPVLERLGKR